MKETMQRRKVKNEIVIERKTIEDYYGSITRGHERFKREISRSTNKGRRFYVFLEGSIEDLFEYVRIRGGNVRAIGKTLITMARRYDIKLIECKTRNEMEKKIIEKLSEAENHDRK